MKKKTIKTKCVHDDYQVMIDIFAKHLSEGEHKICKRCSLEGCRYGYEPMDKEPADKCIYCGEPRNMYFDTFGVNRELQKSIEKITKKLKLI